MSLKKLNCQCVVSAWQGNHFVLDSKWALAIAGAKSPLAQSCPVQNPRRTTRYRPPPARTVGQLLRVHFITPCDELSKMH